MVCDAERVHGVCVAVVDGMSSHYVQGLLCAHGLVYAFKRFHVRGETFRCSLSPIICLICGENLFITL